MEDRLQEIQENYVNRCAYLSDVRWLIAEVERLRSDRKAINDDLVRGARAEIEVDVLRQELARLRLILLGEHDV